MAKVEDDGTQMSIKEGIENGTIRNENIEDLIAHTVARLTGCLCKCFITAGKILIRNLTACGISFGREFNGEMSRFYLI